MRPAVIASDTMNALVFSETAKSLAHRSDYPVPKPGPDEALIRVVRAGICSTDIHIVRGYVPGFDHVLGHEFVGVVEACAARPELVGKRVVGEINCNCAKFTCSDAIFQRNHAPGRTVLGIIGKDGAMAELVTLPAPNLHVVPDALCDDEAVFAEPLAAACRIHEQGLPKPGSSVAVVGDGKLGLLVAQVLVCKGDGCRVTLLGRHPDKMALVSGLEATRVVDESTAAQLAGQFDMTVEASGSSQGIKLALALTRPLGTVLLKSTVSLHDPSMPGWSEVANDVVVNEKVLVGSRCGPFDVALRVLEQHAELRTLVRKMTHSTYHISRGVEAMATAQQKGTLKVLLRFDRLRPSGLTEEQRIAGK